MNGKEFGGYQAGRFEATNLTRNAFTGDVREKTNIRSQQLAVNKNDTHQVQTFTPEQSKIKTDIISTDQKLNRTIREEAYSTYNQSVHDSLRADQLWQLDMQLPLVIEQKLGKSGKDQVLAAIKARKAQAEKTANTETAAQEQVALTNQEVKTEVNGLLAQAPEALLIGSFAALAVWVINRLPSRVYKITAITTILALALSACAAVSKTPSPEIPTQPGAVASETINSNPSTEETNPAAATEVTIAELETLNTDISQKIDEAVKVAEETNPAAAAQFAESNGAETAANIFAGRLSAERILDPKAYEISLVSTTGQARLEIIVDSPWGEAGEVSVIDTGEQDGMFLSLEGGLEALGISDLENCEIFYDEGGWYAAIKDQSGNTIGVVGQEKKWTADIENATQLEPLFDASSALDTYLESGSIDTSEMSTAEFAEFSKALAEKRNADRGISVVVFDNGDGNPAYIDGNLDMRPYDGSPDQSEVIEMFLPVAGKDSAGNLQVEQDGKIITISNSADVDWNMIVTDSNDPRIDWPTGEAKETLNWMINEYPTGPVVLKPMILLDKTPHSFFIEGFGMKGGFKILSVEETDANGMPILFRVSLVEPVGPLLLEEGTDLKLRRNSASLEMSDDDKFFSNLQTNSVYYIGLSTNADKTFKINFPRVDSAALDNYQGIIASGKAFPILTNQENDKENFTVFFTDLFLKKK
ncbi:hypothetical protein KKI22_03740 [Patescibacteria group bacterium]|nr:hypothetical protein [Patescibacteria group bacterium]